MLLSSIVALPAFAQTIVLDRDMSVVERSRGWLPYAFSTESLDTALGVAGGVSGTGRQRQMGAFGTLMGTTNDSWSLIGVLNDYRVPGAGRLFLDSFLMLGRFTDDRVYADITPDPTRPRAGANDSDPDDFLSGVTEDIQFELTLKRPLALGSGRDDPVSLYRLDRGLLMSGPGGGERWNPLRSGKTTLAGKFFFRHRELDEGGDETEDNDVLFYDTNGLQLWLEHDNTDFPANPARGSRQKLIASRDFGWFDSTNSWTTLQADLSKYFDLGRSDWFRQRVLALDFWTSYSPSWETDEANPQIIRHRPPGYLGSTLGGYDRLRAYPSGRFNDKAAVYYGAELRLIPEANPLRDLPILDYFEIDWWQLVGFVEAGRVGRSYDTDLFTDDLQFDAGLGFRLMAFRTVVRLDWAASDEGSSIWAMVSQPFGR